MSSRSRNSKSQLIHLTLICSSILVLTSLKRDLEEFWKGQKYTGKFLLFYFFLRPPQFQNESFHLAKESADEFLISEDEYMSKMSEGELEGYQIAPWAAGEEEEE